MELRVDLNGGIAETTLQDPHDFKDFRLLVGGPPSSLPAVVRELAGTARIAKDPANHAFIDPNALRRLAGEHADEQWNTQLDAMIAYASGKGWVAADGFIRAHIVWAPDDRPSAAA